MAGFKDAIQNQFGSDKSASATGVKPGEGPAGQGSDGGQGNAGSEEEDSEGSNAGSGSGSSNAGGSETKPAAVVQPNYEKWLEETTGGKFKSVADLQSYSPVSFADQRIKEANEFAAKGGNWEDYLRISKEDYTKLDDVAVMAAEMKLKNPSLSEEEINAVINMKYNISEDDFSQLQRTAGQAQLKMDASATRQNLIEQQKAQLTPPDKRDELNAAENAKKATQQWEASVKKAMGTFKGLSIKTDDSRSFAYSFADEAQKINALQKLESQLMSLDEFGIIGLMNSERYKGDEGLARYAEDVFLLENRDSIFTSLAKNERDFALDDWQKKNLQFPPRHNRNGAPGQAKSVLQQAADKMYGK